MESSDPVASPTAIICTTMGGKTDVAARGSAIVFPSLMFFRVSMRAFSTILLPAVRLTISSPSRMGTPLEIMVERVRVNFAMATFRIRGPITGGLRIMRSNRLRPWSVW